MIWHRLRAWFGVSCDDSIAEKSLIVWWEGMSVQCQCRWHCKWHCVPIFESIRRCNRCHSFFSLIFLFHAVDVGFNSRRARSAPAAHDRHCFYLSLISCFPHLKRQSTRNLLLAENALTKALIVELIEGKQFESRYDFTLIKNALQSFANKLRWKHLRAIAEWVD